ncbi:MAG: tRNA (N6-threonylcarbamoyladenosine(37)-N6)-methyltransferase TrmO [Blautia sp.]|nr:tRNA (N6-threonylcarbamoyladenosine(37)-N6)-methyltransferase TrmO [Blautia sp.]MDY5031597.1 tRNA (N6-threonylcarbamoyladenosine(37)-N6)-methyltransferase TrmO [Blautia sp.]
MKIIAHIRTDFPTKFGIPRQSGCVESLRGRIIMEPEYRQPEAFRGLEDFSHIWLLWEFSEAIRSDWSPTVRPPRLGGNVRKGVFATRSPFRPNPLGLSCVKLEKIEFDKKLGPVLYVTGADLMDRTPIYDIKPYLPEFDSHPSALGGFTAQINKKALEVAIPEELLLKLPEELRQPLREVLAHDPRPGYQEDPHRIYGMPFGGFDVRFWVAEGILRVCRVEEYKPFSEKEED